MRCALAPVWGRALLASTVELPGGRLFASGRRRRALQGWQGATGFCPIAGARADRKGRPLLSQIGGRQRLGDSGIACQVSVASSAASSSLVFPTTGGN